MAVDEPGIIGRIVRGRIARYLVAVIAVALALLVRVALERQSITLPTYITFYPVVLLAALLDGILAGVLATALSALLADYFLIAPVGQFAVHSTSDMVGLGIFCFSGVFVSVVAEGLHRYRVKVATSKIDAAVLDERRKVTEAVERSKSTGSERQRLLDVLESLQTRNSSTDSSEGVQNGRELRALGHESGLPILEQARFRAALRWAVGVPFIAALILAGAALWAAYDLNTSMQLVDHSDRAIGQSRRVFRLLVDMESGERGYLVTGNDAFLKPYREASKLVDSEYQTLYLLVADSPSQQARLKKLHDNVLHWQGYAGGMIALRRAGGAYSDIDINLAGKAEVDEIRDEIAAFQSVEEQLRDERNLAAHRDWRLVATICILLGLGVGAGLAVFTLRRMEAIAASFENSRRALQESERRWVTTLASIGDAVIATDNDGRVTFLNQVAAALTGWQPEDAIGQPFQIVFRTVNERTRVPAEDIVGLVLKHGRVSEMANHTALLAKDGREIPIADSASPIFEVDGGIAGVVLVFRDVTEQRRAESVLQTTLQRFYTILSNLNSGILLVTDEGRIEFANQIFCDLFGFGESPGELMETYDSEKVLGKIRVAYKHPSQAILRIRELVQRGETVRNEEVPMLNGRSYLRDFIPLTVDGRSQGRMWVHTDITELKRVEEAIRESQAKLQAALASMADSVVITDAQGRFVEFNEAYAKFYRFKSKAECVKSFDEFTRIFEVFMANGEPAPREMYAIQRALRGETATNTEYTLRRNDTGESWIGGISFGPIRGKDGEIIGSVVTARDITEAKHAEEERQIAIDFLGMVNRSRDTRDLIERASIFFQRRSGCEAVGIRMRDGDDYPYLETRGFSDEFVRLESKICRRAASGRAVLDSSGKPVLECLCGTVIRGSLDTSKPFYTVHGSFWSNGATDLVAAASEGDLPSTMRNRCNRAGYQSVALLPMYVGDERFGLVQLNDRNKGRFSAQTIALWERMAGHLATAVSKFRAEEALLESEKRYRNLFNTMNEGFCIIEVLFDANGKPEDYRFLEVNAAFEMQTGMQDAVGKRMRELAPEHESYWFEIYGNIALTGEPAHFTSEAKALNRWYDVHAYRVGEPEMRRVAIVFNDFSDYKRAEEALRASELRFRLALTNAPVSVAMQDCDLVYRWAYNPQTRSTDEIVGKTDADLFAAEEVPAIVEAKRRVLETGVPEHVQQWLTSNGNRLFLDLYYEPTRNAAGEIDGIGIAVVDLTEQKRAEEALQKSEAHFRNLANAIPQLCWMANADGWIFWYNERWYEYTGTTPEMMEGWGWQSVHDPDALPQVMERWKDTIATGSSFDMVFPIRGADGVFRQFLTRVMPVKDPDGKVMRWFGTNTDISERKRMEEQLKKLNRTLLALSKSNQSILHATDEPSFLKEVCRIVTRDCGHAMVWVGVAEHDEKKTVRPIAFSGFDQGYLETLNISWDESERGRGPTGTAIRSGQPSLCRDMRNDPAFTPWRDEAIKRGYASSLVIPLKDRDETWGAITIYSRQPDAFSEGEIELLTELAGDVEFGIQTMRVRAAHARAEEALRESKDLLALFVEHAPAALAMFDGQMRYLYASLRWRADYGLGDRELRGVSHYDVFPEISERWKEAHRRGLAGEVLHMEADRFERSDGSEQWIRWEVRPWRDAEGRVGGIVIFSEEITERRKAEEAQLRSEKETFRRHQLQALAARLQQAREEERKMVARDLHDQIGQILTAVKMDVAWAVQRMPSSKDSVRDRLKGSVELINEGVRSVRQICSGLRPGILDDLGLAAAIEWQMNEFASRTGISCQATVLPGELSLGGDRATAIFRIFQECLTNIARHANARSVRASLYQQDEDLILAVADDGKGFSESEVAGSLGVLGMKERAQACGGSVQVSSSPGKGTTVTVRIPVHAANDDREDHAHSDSR